MEVLILVLQSKNPFLFLGSKGTPSVKFLSIEKVEIAHVDGLKASILQAFERLKLTNLKKKNSH